MKKIAVIGSSNIDLVLGVDSMPKGGQTVIGKSMIRVPGGKGANQACACAKLHGQCSFFSAIGCDDGGDILIDSLKKAGVDTGSVIRVESEPTGTAIIFVDSNGENTIVVHTGANNCCNRDYFDQKASLIEEADYVLAQLETPLDDIYNLLSHLKESGKVIVLNPAPAPGKIPDRVFSTVDYLTPNEHELASITGLFCNTPGQVEEAARQCVKRGAKKVIVTLGKQGVMFVTEDEAELIPAFVTNAVDTTAAGDTFNGAFVSALAEGMDEKEALRFANAAAAIAVSRHGAQPSIPTLEEVRGFLTKFP